MSSEVFRVTVCRYNRKVDSDCLPDQLEQLPIHPRWFCCCKFPARKFDWHTMFNSIFQAKHPNVETTPFTLYILLEAETQSNNIQYLHKHL